MPWQRFALSEHSLFRQSREMIKNDSIRLIVHLVIQLCQVNYLASILRYGGTICARINGMDAMRLISVTCKMI